MHYKDEANRECLKMIVLLNIAKLLYMNTRKYPIVMKCINITFDTERVVE